MNQLEETRFCVLECLDPVTEEPLVAFEGVYCGRHAKALRGALQLAPAVTEHVVSMLASRSQSESRVSGSRETPLPFNTQAFQDANGVYELLVRMAAGWARHLKTTPPRSAQQSWRTPDGTVQGLPPSIDARDARFVVSDAAEWLKARVGLMTAVQNATVEEAFVQARTVFAVNARWPRTPRPYFSKLPCPSDRGRIAVYPPVEFGDDTRYVCESCGRIFREEDHAFYSHLFVQQESPKTARHLERKWVR